MKRYLQLIVLGLVTLVAASAAVAADVALTTVILVRHAEKVDDSKDPMLSDAGKARAELLASMLSSQSVDAIFSTPFHRTRDTAAPVARAAGLEIIEIEPTASHATDLAERLRGEYAGKTVVVVGHSNTVPQIIAALGIDSPPEIGHDEYDDLFIVTLAAEGARLLHLEYGDEAP